MTMEEHVPEFAKYFKNNKNNLKKWIWEPKRNQVVFRSRQTMSVSPCTIFWSCQPTDMRPPLELVKNLIKLFCCNISGYSTWSARRWRDLCNGALDTKISSQPPCLKCKKWWRKGRTDEQISVIRSIRKKN